MIWPFLSRTATYEPLLNPPVAIICPDYPPRPGGVSDYAARLAGELVRHTPVQLITSPGTHPPSAPITVQHVADWQDEAALFAQLDSLPGETALLWEYVPHMYGRGGVAPAVPRLVRRLATRKHNSQTITAHEIAAPWSWLPNRAWYAWAHRQQWQEIVSWADAVVTSTEVWRDEWQARLPQHGSKFSYAASPSTIPVAPVELRRAWRRQRGWEENTLVLGWFGTASAAKQLDWVLAAQKCAQAIGRPVALILIGKAEDIAVAQKSALIQSTGYVEAAAVSQVLQSIDLLLLPFIDGVSERRTSFMAGLAHGTPIATTCGHNTGPTLRQADICSLAPSNDPAVFFQQVTKLLAEPAARRDLGERGRAYYHAHYDWSLVAQHLLQLLRQKGHRE